MVADRHGIVIAAQRALDRMLEALIEDEASVAEAAKRTGVDEAIVADIEKT